MRRIGLIVLGVVVVLAALVVILPFVVPVDAYKSRIEAEATAATGRQLKINGPLHLTIFPELGLKAEKVTLANVPGGKAPYLASMHSLRVGVQVMPLLSGRIAVSEITLDKPAIYLEADKSGHGNWMLGSKKQAAEQTSPAGTAGGGVAAAAKAQFSGLKIADGTISYHDAATGKTRKIEHINLTLGLTSLDKPLTLDGSLIAQGLQISLDGRVTSLKAIMDGKATPVNLSLTSKLVQASFKGSLARASADGLLKLDTPSVRKLAAWSGSALPPGGGLQHLSLEGQLSARGQVDRFSAIKLVLDNMTLTGALTLDRSRKVPRVDGTLDIDDLNLNPYLAGTTSEKSAEAQAAKPVQGKGWSKKPIDLAVLKAMDAKLTLRVGKLELRKLKLGKTTLAVNLQGGALNSRLDPITLYGGSGVATLKVDARRSVPHISEALKFQNLQIKPFLTDALGIDRIEGTGTITLNADADGRSPNAITHDLAGKGAITFLNGRVRGVDLAGVARTIKGALSGQAISSSASTDFTEMGGTFTIQKGVMTSKDFHLLSPFIRLTGAGNVNLGEQSIDFVVEPKAVASMKGQGGEREASGIGIPFRIHGPWTNIHYTPDLKGVATDILKAATSGKLSGKGVLEGLFGGAQKSDQKSGAKKPAKKKNPADMLKDLLGGGH